MALELPVDGGVKHWRIPKVAEWLQENGMGVYVEDFRDEYIDGDKLLNGYVNKSSLQRLNVHHRHISAILEAIKNYKFYNPGGEYDFSSDEDGDDFPDDGQLAYNGPDDIQQARQQIRRLPPPPPQDDERQPSVISDGDDYVDVDPSEDDLLSRLSRLFSKKDVPSPGTIDETLYPTSEYDVVSGTSASQSPLLPPPIVRYGHGSSQGLNVSAESLGSTDEPDNLPAPPVLGKPRSLRELPPTPPEEGLPPPIVRQHRNERLTSLPDNPAPLPPSTGNKPHVRRGQRPPAPDPPGGNISTTPTVPASQSLDAPPPLPPNRPHRKRSPSPEQETYEPVDPDPPQPPVPVSHPVSTVATKPKPNKNPYPKVTLPSQSKNSTAAPAESSTNKKKVTPYKYTDHMLQNENNGSTASASSSVPQPKQVLPVKPDTRTLRPYPTDPASKANSTTSSQEPVDVSGMSVKERMKLLAGKGGDTLPVGGFKAPPPNVKFSNQKQDIGKMMQEKIQQRKQPVPTTSTQSSSSNNNNFKFPLVTPSAQEKSSPPVSNRPPVNRPLVGANKPPAVPQQVPPTLPPPRPTERGRGPLPHPPHMPLPGTPPMIPTSDRPKRRDSTGSAISTSSASTARSNDDDRGLYNYTWYHSDIKREEAATILNRKQHNGAFLVRKSARDPNKPFTLDVIYDSHDFHIPLRCRHDGNFALGEPKENEQNWPSVSSLVGYFKRNMINLTKKHPTTKQLIKETTLLVE